MSTKYFQRFEKLYYKFGDETSYSLFQNLTQYVDIIDQVKPQQAFYEDYTIKSGDRPDTLALQLYGDYTHYWTFYLMNDHLRESGWPLKTEELLERAKGFYPHRIITTTADIATAEGGYDFKVGRTVTGQISGTVGTIIKRNLDLGQLTIDTEHAYIEDNEDFVVTINTNGAAEISLTDPLKRFANTDQWILLKKDLDNPTADPVSLTGYTLTLSQIDTVVNIRNIPFEVGNYEYTLTARVRLFNDGEARFQAGEQIYFRDDTTGLVVFARIHREDAQYNAVHHYENAAGEYVDIDPFVEEIPSSLTEVTYYERMVARNEDLKQIKVLKGTSVESVTKEFYRLTNNR
jgi:hypothetical protein